MSTRIRQAIVVALAGVAMIGSGTMNTASAGTASTKTAVADASHRAATTIQLHAKPCHKDRSCKQGYSAGYSAGRASCSSDRRSRSWQGSRGFGRFQRGFDMGFDRARSRFC